MKKKVFSLMMGLLLTFTGLARANELTVHDGTIQKNEVPAYVSYFDDFTRAQSVYPAAELAAMYGGTIESIKFYTTSSNIPYTTVSTVNVYLTEVDYTTISSYVPTANCTVVYTGKLSFVAANGGGECTITLSTPYTYNGGNLLLGIENTNDLGYQFMYFLGETVTGASISGYNSYSLANVTVNQRNYLPKTTFTYEGGSPAPERGLHVVDAEDNVDVINMGPRPASGWMRPYAFTMTYDGAQPISVSMLEFTPNDGYFTMANAELPIAFTYGTEVQLAIATGESTEELVERQFVAIYDATREAAVWDITAEPYTPECPDMWEVARIITDAYPFEYRDTPTTTYLHDNYMLPPSRIDDGIDAVYKVTFDQDVLLNGTVTNVGTDELAENAKMAIYTEGFNGVGGPDINNNYVGPQVGPTPVEGDEWAYSFDNGLDGWTNIDADGDGHVWYHSTEASNHGTIAVTSHSGAGHIMGESYCNDTYDVLYPNDYFVAPTQSAIVNGSTFSFYACAQDENYAAEHFGVAISTTGNTSASDFTTISEWTLSAKGGHVGNPAATRNGKGNREGNWYQFSVDLSEYAGQNVWIAVRHFNCSDEFLMCLDDAELSINRANRNRDAQQLTVYDGNDTNEKLPFYTLFNDEAGCSSQFVIPASDLTAMNGKEITSMNFHIFNTNNMTAVNSASWKVYVKEVGYTTMSGLESLTGATVVKEGYNTLNPEQTRVIVDFATPYTYNGGNLLIGFDIVSLGTYTSTKFYGTATSGDAGYCRKNSNSPASPLQFIPETTFTYEEGSQPGPGPEPELEYIINNMTVVPGTYYIAASSTQDAWDVVINATELPCPEMASHPTPADNADGLEPAAVNLSWELGENTTEYRLVFGSTYYCEDVLVDWTSDLAQTFTVTGLFNNTNYFWRIDERNSNCEINGEVWGFTTHLNIPQNLTVEDEFIFEGENAVLSWTAIQDRTYRYYNVYQDGELIYSTPADQVVTTYTVEGLTYNMEGYNFYVTAVYDEGESNPSNEVKVKVSGNGIVEGHVYEQDNITGIAGATVLFVGTDEFGDPQTFSFTTGADGSYSNAIMVGTYTSSASCPGYNPMNAPLCGNPITIVYDETTAPVDFVLDENFLPVSDVIAEYYPDPTDPSSPYVKVYWGWNPISMLIDNFETGDFSHNNWEFPTADYPWEITTSHPYEGTYCMQSGGYNVPSVTSTAQVTINAQRDGMLSFYSMISSESSFDKGTFYIDGTQMGVVSGTSSWTLKQYAITAGTHTLQWTYTKDGSVNSGEDRWFVDYISFENNAAAANREFKHFRVYRTGCYNDGPYTEDNTVVLACELLDTVYIDVSWPDAAFGVYKWGVGVVYEGNRESAIAWTEPTVVPAQVEAEVESTNRSELTVFDGGSTSYYVPVYGLFTDAYLKCEYIMPAAQLSAMTGTEISKMRFYLETPASASWDPANFKVFMKEVAANTISAYTGYADATVVYQGPLDGTQDVMDVNFTTPYTYNGGNLLIGFYNETIGTYKSSYFYGQDASGACVQGYSYNSLSEVSTNQRNFLPKTTFTYGGGGGGQGGGTIAGNDPIQEPRESPIVWSNCLDKDMYLDHVSVNVILNSGDSPEGVLVTFTNLSEEEQALYPVDPIVLDESGYYAWDSFRRGEYMVTVALNGYQTITVQEPIFENRDLRYVMTELFGGIKNLYVSRTGWAMWEPETPGGGGEGFEFSEDFEGGAMPEGWTSEGPNNWTVGTGDNDASTGAAEGNYNAKITHVSTGATTYLVTPMLDMTGINTATLNFSMVNRSWAGDIDELHVCYRVDGGAWNTLASYTSANSSWTAKSVELTGMAANYQIGFKFVDRFGHGVGIDAVNITTGRSGERHLQYYKVMCTSIDNVPIFNHNTVVPMCQLDTNDPYQAPLVEGETYLCKVACMYSTGLGEWSEQVAWVYEPCEHWGPVDFVEFVDDSEGNHIHWEFENGYNPYDTVSPGPVPPGPGDEFFESFENGFPAGWSTIDADGDGFNWILASELMAGYVIPAHSGADCISSQSYDGDYYGALTPDNYLVSPQVNITNGSTFSFWACAQDPSYPSEHFGVAISTTTPTADAFTTINEWTMTAKKAAGAGEYMSKNGRGTREGNWYPYEVDLSAYAGQQVYIAIRHFDCSDWFYLNVDDVELAINGAKGYNATETGMLRNGVFAFNITDITTFDERIYTIYNLINDRRFDVIIGEADGMFIITEGKELDDAPFEAAINEFFQTTASNFAMLDKFEASTTANAYKANMPASFVNSLMMDIYVASRQNNLCELADPFCTDNGMYEFPAGVNAGYGETGPDYDCLYSTPNPAWYYMRIADPGDMDIYMYSTPGEDIDFCCWGPFDDPTTPCPNGLTSDKVVSCSYSINPTEDCIIPASAQTGEYYILVITNYSNDPCNINFSKVSGSGSTDCGILPPVDIIGFLITLDGEYLDIVGPTVRDYVHEGEYGNHVYCVRPIYPGEMTLPDHNYGWSMGCPVCTNMDCAAPSHLEGTYEWRNGQFGALISWVIDSRDIVSYNIFRSNDGIVYEKIGTIDGNHTEYFDPVEVGTYYYQVTAVSDCGESVPALTESGYNFVIVTVTGINEIGNVTMYPNPTNGNVKIVANAMNHITVVNSLGQVVYDKDIDSDEMTINMAQFNVGVYTVRVATESGVSVQRLTVVR